MHGQKNFKLRLMSVRPCPNLTTNYTVCYEIPCEFPPPHKSCPPCATVVKMGSVTATVYCVVKMNWSPGHCTFLYVMPFSDSEFRRNRCSERYTLLKAVNAFSP